MLIEKRLIEYSFLIFVVCFFTGCNSPYTPKPRGYFKIAFPTKKYVLFDRPGYPYQFEYPDYAEVVKDSTFFGDKTENPWWVNINFPKLNGHIYVSYKEIGSNSFSKLIEDSYKLTNKHNAKASSIDDSSFQTGPGTYGVLFNVGGEVATANQFFITDSTKHFLRGALYFDASPNQDSLAPVNSFLLADMKHLISTFHWK